MKLNDVCLAMIEYDCGDARRIQHFIKVHSFARLIGEMENLSEEEQYVLEIAAYVHDIGIRKSEELYGDCSGKHQEELGPDLARQLLLALGCEERIIMRVCYLVGHHHTYTDVNGRDYQILIEADFLVNLQEEQEPRRTVEAVCKNVFRTETGRKLCRKIFSL